MENKFDLKETIEKMSLEEKADFYNTVADLILDTDDEHFFDNFDIDANLLYAYVAPNEKGEKAIFVENSYPTYQAEYSGEDIDEFNKILWREALIDIMEDNSREFANRLTWSWHNGKAKEVEDELKISEKFKSIDEIKNFLISKRIDKYLEINNEINNLKETIKEQKEKIDKITEEMSKEEEQLKDETNDVVILEMREDFYEETKKLSDLEFDLFNKKIEKEIFAERLIEILKNDTKLKKQFIEEVNAKSFGIKDIDTNDTIYESYMNWLFNKVYKNQINLNQYKKGENMKTLYKDLIEKNPFSTSQYEEIKTDAENIEVVAEHKKNGETVYWWRDEAGVVNKGSKEDFENYLKSFEVERIISHKPPRHLDDALAIAFLKSKYPQAKVEFVAPQQDLETEKNNPKVVLVDVGGDYNENLNNLDHHHNKDIPSSIILTLKKHKELFHHPVLEIIDYIDRYGFKKASDDLGLKPNKEIDEKRKMVLMADYTNTDVAKAITEELKKLTDVKEANQPTIDFDSFITNLYENLDKKGLLENVKEQIRKEKEEFENKLNSAEIIDVDGLKVIKSDKSFAPFHSEAFKKLDADLIIERNAMNPNHTSVIKNTTKPDSDKIDLGNISENQIFLHNTGFILVIDKNIEEIDKETVEKYVSEAKMQQSTPAVKIKR